MTSICTIFLFAFLFLIGLSQADERGYDVIDSWFEVTLNAPGGGYVIVTKDSLVHHYVTGVKDITTGEPVTRDTYFPIASVTKTLTSLLIHNLTLEGKCSWDSRIASILPFWECGDPIRSSMMTLQDLVYHRTGFGYGTGSLPSFTNPNLSLRDYVYSMKFFMPLAEFRAPSFLYNDAAFSLAGYIPEYIEDTSFRDLIQERILNKLPSQPKGYYSLADLKADDVDYSKGYMVDEETGEFYEPPQVVNEALSHSSAPAGGLALSLNGLAEFTQWFIPVINSSSYAPLTDMGNFPPFGTMLFGNSVVTPVGIGRGVFIYDVMGFRCYSHNGNAFGHTSLYVVCPDVDYGFAGLNNMYVADDNLMITAFLGLFQFLTGEVPPPEATEPLSTVSFKNKMGSYFKDGLSPKSTKIDRVFHVKESLQSSISLVDFNETSWHHPFYGSLVVNFSDSIVDSEWRYNHLLLKLSHFHNNVYYADSAFDRILVQFGRCPLTGKITSVKMFFVDENALFTSENYLNEDMSFHPNDAATQDPRVVKFVEPAVYTNNMPIALILGVVVGLIASGVVGGLMFYFIRKSLNSFESYSFNPMSSNKV
ncbi:hypothetical protein GEMRC1_000673 [Eukaryota sp. GEM-RC1]